MLELLDQLGPWGVIVPVGVVVAAAVYLALRNVGRAEPPPAGEKLAVEADDDPHGERRANPRKRTTPVVVDLVDPAGVMPRQSAIVVDFSTGGLKLRSQDEVPPDSAWTVIPRSSGGPVKVGLPVQVRECLRHEDHFVLHCQFTRTVSYNELLNFG